MARTVTQDNSSYLGVATGFSLAKTDAFWAAGWVKQTSAGSTRRCLTVASNGFAQWWLSVMSAGAIEVGQMNAGGTAGNTNTSTSLSAGTWGHIIGSWESSASRTVWLNDGGSANNTTSVNLSATNDPTDFELFRHDRSATLNFGGTMAYVGIWSGTPTAGQRAMLAVGVHPAYVSPHTLLGAWDLSGYSSPEVGMLGFPLTITGTATDADAPRIMRPHGRSMVVLGASSGGGGSRRICSGIVG